MRIRKKILILILAAFVFTSAASTARADENEFDAVCKHIKTKYEAKKVNFRFMWLARLAVGVIRPAGVKSFKVTIFRDLKFSRETLGDEMKGLMQDSFGQEWSPILRVKSRQGSQVYMNIREAGKNLKMVLVSIDKDEAIVVRAKFSPRRLAEFVENPRVFGISLNGRSEDNPKEIDGQGKSPSVVIENEHDHDDKKSTEDN